MSSSMIETGMEKEQENVQESRENYCKVVVHKQMLLNLNLRNSGNNSSNNNNNNINKCDEDDNIELDNNTEREFDITKWKEQQLAERERIRHLERTPEPPKRPPKKADLSHHSELGPNSQNRLNPAGMQISSAVLNGQNPRHPDSISNNIGNDIGNSHGSNNLVNYIGNSSNRSIGNSLNNRAGNNISNNNSSVNPSSKQFLGPRPFSGIKGLKPKVKPVVPPKPVLDPQTKTLLNLRLKQVDPANMLMQQSDGNFWTGSLGDVQAADGHEVRNQNSFHRNNNMTRHPVFTRNASESALDNHDSGGDYPADAADDSSSSVLQKHKSFPNLIPHISMEPVQDLSTISSYTNCKPVLMASTYPSCENTSTYPNCMADTSEVPSSVPNCKDWTGSYPNCDGRKNGQRGPDDNNWKNADRTKEGEWTPGCERARLVRVDSQLSDYSLYQQLSPNKNNEENQTSPFRFDVPRQTKYEKTVYNSGLQKLTIVKSEEERSNLNTNIKNGGSPKLNQDGDFSKPNSVTSKSPQSPKEKMIAEELERAKSQKEELIQRIVSKTAILREEREHVQEELQQNQLIAEEILSRLEGLARIRDLDRIRRHMDEVGTLTSLILGLSCRLARLEADTSSQADKAREDKLRSQLEEAKELQDLSLARRFNLKSIISGHLDELAGHSFLVYLEEKARLIMECRELEDKLGLAQQQVKSLSQI